MILAYLDGIYNVCVTQSTLFGFCEPSMSVNLVHGLLLQIKEISSIVEISSKQASRYLQLLQTEKLWIFQTGVNLVSYHALWLLQRIEAWEFAFEISQSALESPVDRAQRAGEFYHRQLAAEIAVEAVFRLRILATDLFLQLLDEEDHVSHSILFRKFLMILRMY